jgi:hypothetical protein
MNEQISTIVALGVLGLTFVLVVLIAARFRVVSNDPAIIRFGMAFGFLVLGALSWFLCYLGFISGVMMSITRRHQYANDLAADPTGYWVALAFGYILGAASFSVAAIAWFARKTKE